MAEKLATLSFSDGTPSVDFPVLAGSVGPDVIDIRPLYNKTQKFTYDPGFIRDAHPMAVLCGVVGALSAFYHDSLNINDPRHREISAFRLVAKLPTITAMCYKYNIGMPFMHPKNSLSYIENFLRMMFGN